MTSQEVDVRLYWSQTAEQRGMPIESADERIGFMQHVTVLAGEPIRRQLVSTNGARPDEHRQSQRLKYPRAALAGFTGKLGNSSDHPEQQPDRQRGHSREHPPPAH